METIQFRHSTILSGAGQERATQVALVSLVANASSNKTISYLLNA